MSTVILSRANPDEDRGVAQPVYMPIPVQPAFVPLPKTDSFSDDGFMVGQLIMHLQGQANPILSIVSNTDNRAPISFEDPDTNVLIPRLGSSQLIFLTEYLQAHKFVVEEFQLADAYMSPLSGGEAGRASKRLVKAMRKKGASRVRELLATELRPLVIIGADFMTDQLDSLTVKQDGVVLGGSIASKKTRVHIENVLTNAWKLTALR